MATKLKLNQLVSSSAPGAIIGTDVSNIPAFVVPTSGADRIVFYDDSATAIAFLTLGTNLSITGTTLNATAGAGGYSAIQEEGSGLTARSTLNFIGAGFTAADDAGNSRTNVTLDATLNALAAYNTNGILVQTAADTFVGRTITGTINRLVVTMGDGVLGNPNLDIAATYAGQTSITTLGTITAGTWQGTTIAGAYGGTGQTTTAVGDLLVGAASNTWNKLTIGGSGTVLKSNGTTASWGTLSTSDLSDSANIALLNATQTFTNTITFGNAPQFAGTSSAANDLTNVTYVTNAINTALAGIRKGSVRVATTANGTLATAFANGQIVDGVTLVTGNLILLKNQTAQAENGVYTVNASGAPTRATWMDSAAEIDGVYVAVEDGTANNGTLWITVSEVTTLGTDAIVFTQINTNGAVSSVTITQPAAGITITNTGVAQTGATTSTFALANDLAALEALSTSGFAARTGTDTWAIRSIAGTSNRITITNPAGTAGDPTIDISASYVGQTSITTLGTITVGTWNGTTIAQGFGGTGFSTYTTGDILYASATNTLSKRGIGSTNDVLTVVAGVPTWQAPTTVAITEAFVEGSTSSTIDMDANVGNVKDFDGNNIAFTFPTDLTRVDVYLNGQLLHRTGALTTRDYSVNTTTHVITLVSALVSTDVLYIKKHV